MKIVVASDMHFGDPACSLVYRSDKKKPYQTGPKYQDFVDAAGTHTDFLVLLGDVLDFSIVSYQEAYDAARAFFVQANKDKIAKEIIYVPGNHDFAFWHIIMHEANIINRVKALDPNLKNRWSSPGILDDRKQPDPADGLILPRVSPNKTGPKYGGLFLDYLTIDDEAQKPITFNVVYPNLYLITEDEQCVLMTHGHYLEEFWVFSGEIVKEIAKEDLKYLGKDQMNIDDFVSINFPLNELASSGIGQAGPLTDIARRVQRQVKHDDLSNISKYLGNLESYIDRLLEFPWYKHHLEWITDAGLKKVKPMVLEALAKARSHHDDEFLDRPEVRKRLCKYFSACKIEIDTLNQLRTAHYENLAIPDFNRMVFGHTHNPFPERTRNPIVWSELPRTFNSHTGETVTMVNTGAWLGKYPIENRRVGGGLLKYQTGAGMRFDVV